MNREMEKRAIEVLKAFEPEDGYYLCYSGGKDSDCIRILADLAGVKHEIHHNLTTADAPETVYYVKSQPNVIIHKPELSMWRLIEKKMIPPTRLTRYCCAILKEKGGAGRLKITGVRKKESVNRAQLGGLVKIIGKPTTVRKAAETNGVDFEINRLGGTILTRRVDLLSNVTELYLRWLIQSSIGQIQMCGISSRLTDAPRTRCTPAGESV